MTEMTVESIKRLCKEHDLYATPHLNDKLYLHYKGYTKIENLDLYTGVKVLWLEGNGFHTIQGLDSCTNLRTLYLQENFIDHISGLQNCTQLVSLNLAQNNLSSCHGLPVLEQLETLNLAQNRIQHSIELEPITTLPKLAVLDLSGNKITDSTILDTLQRCPELKVLYLKGNPVVKQIPHYRRQIIGRFPALKYLDDRPIFPEERQRCDVWWAEFQASGVDAARAAEREEMERQRVEKARKEEENFLAFERLMGDSVAAQAWLAEPGPYRNADGTPRTQRAEAGAAAQPAYPRTSEHTVPESAEAQAWRAARSERYTAAASVAATEETEPIQVMHAAPELQGQVQSEAEQPARPPAAPASSGFKVMIEEVSSLPPLPASDSDEADSDDVDDTAVQAEPAGSAPAPAAPLPSTDFDELD